MKKLTYLISAAIVAISLFTTTVHAQVMPLGQVKFDIGIEGAVPTYDARQLSNVIGSATGRFQLGLGDYLAATATSGYYNFFDKTATVNGTSVKEPGLGIVPVKFGLKANLGNSGVYINGEFGKGFETSKDNSNGGYDDKNILAAGLGFMSHNFDYSVRYESFTGQNYDYGFIALRIAYGIKL